MSIGLRCSKCQSDFRLGTKKCSKCGTVVGKRKKYRVVVWQGKKRITRMSSNLQTARDIESKLKVDIARGEHDLRRKAAAPTLDEVWKKYLPFARERKKSWMTDQTNYEIHIKPLLGGRRLDEISPFDVEKLVSSMKKKVSLHGKPYSAATIRHQIVLLSRLYSVAIKWDLYEGTNPCDKVKKPKLNNMINEQLTDEQLQRLHEVLEGWDKRMDAAIVWFALYTGMRRGEIFNLTWDDVDLDRKRVVIRDPKGQVDQDLPLSDEAVRVLLEVVPRREGVPWIFWGRGGMKRKEIRKAWMAIRDAAKLPSNFRFHGLRHTYASCLVSSGGDLYATSKMLGHKDIKTTQRYAHLSDDKLRQTAELSGRVLTPQLKKNLQEDEGDVA